jgi:steroid 5-alpha reductase family enzyme
MTFWTLVLSSLAVLCLFMASVWVFARAVNNAGFVDVAWAFSFTLVAVVCLFLGPRWTAPGLLLTIMMVLWSVRLGTYLLQRVVRHHPTEDSRYQTLRRQFPQRTWLLFFGFFQAQAILTLVLSLPLLLVVSAGPARLHPLHFLGLALWLIALVGESLADFQLETFRRNPQNRGRTCRSGLWRYSRHPNYFFEWIFWISYFVFALPTPLGFLTLAGPLIMLYLLLKVTGIPTTEAQSLQKRGAEYRQYMETTSMFLPWPPKK